MTAVKATLGKELGDFQIRYYKSFFDFKAGSATRGRNEFMQTRWLAPVDNARHETGRQDLEQKSAVARAEKPARKIIVVLCVFNAASVVRGFSRLQARVTEPRVFSTEGCH